MTDLTIQTFADYLALVDRTMLPSCDTLDYMIPASIEEIGELARLIAKSQRGDYTFESVQEDAHHECGDVAYMLLSTGRHLELPFPSWMGDDAVESFDVEALQQTYDIKTCLLKLGISCLYVLSEAYLGEIIDEGARKDVIYYEYCSAWRYLAITCHACGCSLKTALNLNNQKLTKRLAQGQIMGDGDHREEIGDAPLCGCID